MSIKSYFDEFERRYNQPQIQSVTVGFSGIDPTPKATYIIDTASSDPSGSGGGSGSGSTVIINGSSNQYGIMEDDDFNSMMDDVFGN